MTKTLSTEASEVRSTGVWLWVEWGLLLAGLGLLTIRETYTVYASSGMILLAGSFAVGAARRRRIVPRTGLEIAWALGLVSGAAAAWISYDRSAAVLQYGRLIAAAVVYYAVVPLPEGSRRWPAFGFVGAAAALAIYWPVHNDFSVQPGKLAAITRLGVLVNNLAPRVPGPDIHSNVAAGFLLAALPMGLFLAWEGWRLRKGWLAGLAIGMSLVVLGGLFMTSSRGAWLALIGTAFLAGLVWLQRRWLRNRPAERRHGLQLAFWGLIGLAGLAALMVIVTTGSMDRLVGSLPDPNGGIQSRTVLWREGWQVVRDYPFTGSGLMSFWLVHPIYVLLINVPFIAHAHNTFLEVWVEQGILGFIGLLLAGMVTASWAWKALGRASVSSWGWAGLAALTAVSLHGLVDVVFYVTRTLPVIGLLFGYAYFMNENPANRRVRSTDERGSRRFGWLIGGATVVLLMALAGLFWRPILAGWYANLGAVLQTRQELTAYNPKNFDTYTLDQVRRDSDLGGALTRFERALAIEPGNREALQRRAEIRLSLGDYPGALADAQRLWEAGRRDTVTRLVYSDALAADGQSEAAAQAAAGLTWAEARLMGQAWYRYWVNQDYRRAADAWQAVLLLNPQADGIKTWLDKARANIK